VCRIFHWERWGLWYSPGKTATQVVPAYNLGVEKTGYTSRRTKRRENRSVPKLPSISDEWGRVPVNKTSISPSFPVFLATSRALRYEFILGSGLTLRLSIRRNRNSVLQKIKGMRRRR
jgi:hypothetical protein